MRKILTLTLVVFLILVCTTQMAFSWGSATHAYIANNIGKVAWQQNMNEMYGAMVPDLFNYMFGAPYQQYLHDQAHGVYLPSPNAQSVLKLWDEAKWELQKALGYGFFCHNDAMAADSTAHWEGAPTTPYIGIGYIIQKARDLDTAILTLAPPGDPLTIFYSSLDAQTREDICHNIVETAGDILIKIMVDNTIGEKVSTSAMIRRPEFPSMLARAYARDFANEFGMRYSTAQKIIRSAEDEFRKMIIGYGQALMQDDATAIWLLSLEMAKLSAAYLGGLPPGATVEDVAVFIQEAIGLCFITLPPIPGLSTNPILADYIPQIEATIVLVAQSLQDYFISY